jgi:membrane-associated phospholipid phosphatase
MAHPSFLINKFAALPSFNEGWVALAGAVLSLAATRPAVRILAMMPAAAMSVAVIVTGNHYVVDVIAGIAICVGALKLAHRRGPRAPNSPPGRRQSSGETVRTSDGVVSSPAA